MKTINYNGFSNVSSSCEYGIGELEGKIAIVFFQKGSGGTSITNMIEYLTSHVLANDLQGTLPENIRVFEHYNSDLNPLIEWQEVVFSDIGVIDEGKSIISKFIDVITATREIPKFYVNNPQWKPVSEENIRLLTQID